jgi:tetratricopeptide (TPR) repeat protein
MDHVNIARVFDGGTTGSNPKSETRNPKQIRSTKSQIQSEAGQQVSDISSSDFGFVSDFDIRASDLPQGRPYFVMELVHGVPITKYCDDNHLTPRERLELFVPVCQAIQHAHQKGIIHRDIKPSNVMVTLYDGKPVPKVIDFGVAKATEQKLTDRTLFTQYGTMIGTLEYMSPEQAEMSALGVDTRSDIYSLGVLLYELLTGSTPLTHKRMKEAAYAEILRMIKEDEPPKPSTRLSDSGEALASISANRHTEPAKLTKLVRGELDWIVMKTLEKDRERRYQSPNSLAGDIQNFLQDEPVQACPPSVVYRLRKFMRRNKGPVLAASLVFLALVAGVIGTTYGMLQARAAAQRADARTQFARSVVDDMYTQVAENWLADAPFMTEIQHAFLVKALKFYEELAKESGADPDVRFETSRAYRRVGQIHAAMGNNQFAVEAAIQAANRLENLVAEFPDSKLYRGELCSTQLALAYSLRELDHLNEAEQAVRRALQLAEAITSEDPDSVDGQRLLAVAYTSLGIGLARTQQADEAEKAFRQALSVHEQLRQMKGASSKDDLSYAATLGDLSELLGALRRTEESIQLARQLLAILEKEEANAPLPFSYRNMIGAFNNGLAGMLLNEGRPKEAEAAILKSRTVREKLYTEFKVPAIETALARTLNNHGKLLARTGRVRDATTTFREALEFQKKVVTSNPGNGSRLYDFAVMHSNRACALCTCSDLQSRDPETALQLAEDAVKLIPADGKPWDTVSTGVVTLYYRQRDQQARVAAIWNTLGIARYRAGNWQGAHDALIQSMRLYHGGDAFDWFFLAMTHWQLGNKEEARKLYARAVEWMNKNLPGDEELRRFRAEAAEVLKTEDKP